MDGQFAVDALQKLQPKVEVANGEIRDSDVWGIRDVDGGSLKGMAKEGASKEVPDGFAKSVQNTKTKKKGGAVSKPYEFAKMPVVQGSNVQDETVNQKMFAVRKCPFSDFRLQGKCAPSGENGEDGQAGDQMKLWKPLMYRLQSSTVPYVVRDEAYSASVYLDDTGNAVISPEPTPLVKSAETDKVKVGKNKVDKPYSQVMEICLDEILSVEGGAATPVATSCVPPAACDRGVALAQRQCPSSADLWSGFVPGRAHMSPQEEWEWVQVDEVEENGKEKVKENGKEEVKEKEKEKEKVPETVKEKARGRKTRRGLLSPNEAARARAGELGRGIRALLFPGRLKRKHVAYVHGYGINTVSNSNARTIERTKYEDKGELREEENEQKMVEGNMKGGVPFVFFGDEKGEQQKMAEGNMKGTVPFVFFGDEKGEQRKEEKGRRIEEESRKSSQLFVFGEKGSELFVFGQREKDEMKNEEKELGREQEGKREPVSYYKKAEEGSEVLFWGRPVVQVREELTSPEPGKICFMHRLQGGLQVASVLGGQSLGDWARQLLGERVWEGMDGYFTTKGGGA